MASFRAQMVAAGQAVRGFGNEAAASSAVAARATSSMGKSFDEIERKTTKAAGSMVGLRNVVAGSASDMRGLLAGSAAAAVAAFGLQAAGSLEQTQVAFSGLLGSAEEADSFIRDMQQFAATTPFEMPGIVKASQQMLALGASTDETLARMKVIGGAIATSGAITQESVDRVVRALAQIQGKGRLASEELNQINEVIPSLQRVQVYTLIGEAMGKSVPQVQALADQGLIPADVALKAIYQQMLLMPGATEAMARQSETLLGRLSTLRDTARQAAAQGFAPMGEAAGNLLAIINPLIGALGGLLGAIAGNAAAVHVIEMMAVAFVAMKIDAFIGGLLFLGQAMITAASGAGILSVALGGLRAAAIGLQTALGPIGLTLTGLVGIYQIFKPAAAGAAEAADLFTEALKKQGDAADDAVNGIIAAQIAEKDLLPTLQAAGISVNDFAGAMTGTAEDAAAFRTRLGELYATGAITETQYDKLWSVFNELGGTLDMNEMKVADLKRVEAELGLTAGATAIAHDELSKSIQKAFSPATAFASAQDSMATSTKGATDAIRDQFDARKEAQAQDERAERQALDRQTTVRKQALDDRLDAEKDAIDAEHELFMDGIEERHRAQDDAFDDEARTRRQALDDQQRDEERALDDRLDLIDRETDAHKKAEERRWETERDFIQFQIDSTFGEEREGWKNRLIQQEDAHDVVVDEIEDHGDDAKQLEKDNLDDRQRQQDNALDDDLRSLQNHLDEKQTAETDAENERYSNAQTAFEARATQQKTALDLEVSDLQTHLDDKYRRLKANLEDAEKAATTAADTRATNAKNNQGVMLSDYQTFLDDELAAADQFTIDMGIIAARLGALGTPELMAQLAEIDPGVIAQAARAGPAAFNAFIDSIRQLLAGGARAPGLPGGVIGGDIRGIGGLNRAAAGRITRGAMISSTPVLWAEAGPEAYIPLSCGRKASATPILAQAASVFGYNLVRMANGGITGGTGRAGGVAVNMPISIEARVSAGVDPDAVGRAIAAHTRIAVDEALDTLGRQVTMKSWRTR